MHDSECDIDALIPLAFTARLIKNWSLQGSPYEIQDGLAETAHTYLWHGPYGLPNLLSDSEHEKQFVEIGRRLGNLEGSLWLMDSNEWSGVIDQLKNDGIDISGARVLGLTGTSNIKSDRAAVIFLRRLTISFRRYTASKTKANAKPKRTKGRPTEKGSEMFIRHLADCWEEWTGKKMTIRAVQGRPESPFLRFAETVLKQIDPGAPYTTVVTAARRARKAPWPT